MDSNNPNDRALRLAHQLMFELAAYPDLLETLNDVASKIQFLDMESAEHETRVWAARAEMLHEGFDELAVVDRSNIESFLSEVRSTLQYHDQQINIDLAFSQLQTALLAIVKSQKAETAKKLAAKAAVDELVALNKGLADENDRLRRLLEGAE